MTPLTQAELAALFRKIADTVERGDPPFMPFVFAGAIVNEDSDTIMFPMLVTTHSPKQAQGLCDLIMQAATGSEDIRLDGQKPKAGGKVYFKKPN